jgi:hypothetical protein
MSYRVTRGADERPTIHLDGEPAYCKALDAAPSAREPELNAGLWLILAFAAWSAPDVAAIQTALDAARPFRGALKLGLRPFDAPEEHAAWCADLAGEEGTPVWVLLRNGQICIKRTGSLTAGELITIIEDSLPCSREDNGRS